MINKDWKLLDVDNALIDQIIKIKNMPRIVAKILALRGIYTKEDIDLFFAEDSTSFISPFLLSDMDKAVSRVSDALKRNQRVVIYGDYDVDGITSTSILYKYLEEIGVNISYYIPDRFEEGYGINENAIRTLKKEGYDLLISVDTGITAIKEVEVASSLGLDVIVTDHHQCKEVLPKAVAVINPKKKDDNYPFKDLAGVGVAFKLICALNEKLNTRIDVNKYLEIVAIGTIADLVSLKGENRLFVKIAFRTMLNSENDGIKALLEVSKINDKITAGSIGYRVAPRLNAAGRLESATKGVELFLSNSYERAYVIASDLSDINSERQLIEKNIFDEAVDIIENDSNIGAKNILVVANKRWHKGVIGIVASRLVEKYYKPTILLSIKDGVASGSARSIDGFSIFDALNSVNDIFVKFGGHSMAAGMSLDVDKVDEFRTRINEYGDVNLTTNLLTPKVYIDENLSVTDITTDFINTVKELEPYGIGNREPRFSIEGEVQDIVLMGADKNHLKMKIGDLSCVGFSLANASKYVSIGQNIKLVGTLDNNKWKQYITPTLYIKDIKVDKYMLEVIKDAVSYHKKNNYMENRLDINVNRAECGVMYKYLKKNDDKKCEEIYYSKIIFELGMDIRKSLLILEIFSSLDLLSYELFDDYFTFEIMESKKVDLKASNLYNYYLDRSHKE